MGPLATRLPWDTIAVIVFLPENMAPLDTFAGSCYLNTFVVQCTVFRELMTIVICSPGALKP